MKRSIRGLSLDYEHKIFELLYARSDKDADLS